MQNRFSALLFLLIAVCGVTRAQALRALSGTLVTSRNEVVAGVTITARTPLGERVATSDSAGNFTLDVPRADILVVITGKNIAPNERVVRAAEAAENLKFEIDYVLPKIHESLVISAAQLEPAIDRRNDSVYRNTLYTRDDQLFHTLDAGINAGQHEGGGKSVEIRRFGFNLDHGGVGGGLKVLVDNLPQNQSTQGHGQGYLGQLKALTPELVQDVEILNGPFSAQYGDFSGLGVVHIQLKESLPDQFTARLQGGSFDSLRSFLAYSPELKHDAALLAYEFARTDGPFDHPLRYRRDNVTGNYVRHLSDTRTLGFKFNFGRNDFVSSGQLPLDEVFAGSLDRFGFLDPDNGGRVRSGNVSVYFKRESARGDVFKFDGFVARSLFDLYSNFTFFLNDEKNGDEIRQHDSRLQEGANAQYLRPWKLFGQAALLTAGANLHENQINVGLDHSAARVPLNAVTRAYARVTNAAGYVQQGLDLLHGHVHIEAGLRYDYFRFKVDDRLNAAQSGTQGASRVQPKFNLAVTPAERVPLTVYFNYGRGIASQDARGVVQDPAGVRVSTTDFYQLGAAHNFKRLAVSADLFLIDRSNEQVYIPDDGSLEFRGPSRAYGFETKTAFKLTNHLAFNGGVTRVLNAFYRGATPRQYVDSAPHTTLNAALTLTDWRGWSGSLRYRHIGNYRLDGFDPALRASGFDVLDLSVNKRLRPWLALQFSADNLTGKRYFETQNYFASRLRPGDAAAERIHATPGYPRTLSLGLAFSRKTKN